jgi:flagellar motor protein MotB
VKEYRRGVLLGLSLAEVFILLLFCFLLLIAPQDIPKTEGQADETQPPPLREDRESVKNGYIDVPFTLDSTPLTLGIEDKSLLSPPLSEHPLLGGTETTNSTIARGTNNDIATPTISTNKEVDQQRPEDDHTPIDIISDPSEAATTTVEVIAVDPKIEPEGKHDWPPIIPLREAEGYKFDTGSAEVSPDFGERLRTVIKDAIIETIKKYPADVIEVVGHTDERPINGASNLDSSLIAVLGGDAPAEQLSSADNVGLGMARAAAVAVVLRSCPELTHFKIIPYSGGQIIEPGDRLATGENSGDRGERRRIEIKIRGSNNSSN